MIDGFSLRKLTPFARTAVVAHLRMAHMGPRRATESSEEMASRQAWGEDILAKLASNDPEEFDDPCDYARLAASFRHLLIAMQVAEHEVLNFILQFAIDPGGIDEDMFPQPGGSP